ncbi:MAG: 16S rRNA (cytosine(1402)-N(4))-methyltransferase RsmH [Gammaproteobacteria bacterium]|jgi:16S rRNA (cytosine1402-N4)-methyltransferase
MPDASTHHPVMLEEVMAALQVRADGAYVDATFGRGGHSAAILQRLGVGGRLIAIDKDPWAVEVARERSARDRRFSIYQGSFAMLEHFAEAEVMSGKVNGVLFDLGVSSPQLDTAERGFSFLREGPLDMRMDTSHGESAAAWLARASEADIAYVLKTYGEERFAKRIARAIVQARRTAPIETTTQLAEIVAAANPAWERDKHPATRAFQAIRIHINRELEDLEQALPQALRVLASGGRLAVISFHSLEDRMVKRFMRDAARGGDLPRRLPVPASAFKPILRIVGKPVYPSAAEVAANPRARSAVLRVAEKI